MRNFQRDSRLKAVVAVLMLASAKAAAADKTQPTAARIVISIPDRKLALLDEDGEVEKVLAVAVGKASTPSPTGRFTVVNRLVNPTWYTRGKVVPPSPANPLGNRWIGLDKHGYGIHGTNAPRSIGKAASHGCIRVGKADLLELFKLVKVGDVVEIRGERDEFVANIFGGEPDGQLVAMAPANPSGGQH